jgi:hypothetical protein
MENNLGTTGPPSFKVMLSFVSASTAWEIDAISTGFIDAAKVVAAIGKSTPTAATRSKNNHLIGHILFYILKRMLIPKTLIDTFDYIILT